MKERKNQKQEPDYLPGEPNLYIGGFHGPLYSVSWNGEALLYSARRNSSEGERPPARIVPSEAAWREFWKQMEAAKIWGWNENYHEYILDGTQWSVVLQRDADGATLKAHDSNSYPEEQINQGEESVSVFTKHLTAVSALIGKRKFH